MDNESKPTTSWFTDEQREKILRNIGLSLVAIQLTEHLVDLALLHVFRENPPTLEEIERKNSPDYRSETLGTLLRILRREAEVDPNFDEKILKPFLNLRNQLVHRMTIGEGKSFNTDAGKLNALNTAFYMFTACGAVMAAIGIPLSRWLETKGADAQVREEVRRLIENLGSDGPYSRVFAEVITPKNISAPIDKVAE
jgi:hypothetical protein